MAPPEQQATPPSLPEPATFEAQGSSWPFVIMAILVFCCLMCLLFLDIRIASLLCMAGCAVVRYLGARAEEGGDDPHR